MDSYFLPNGARIDIERIIEAILEDDAFPQLYLDTETGGFYEVPSEDVLRRWRAEIGDSKRYLLIERFNNEERDEVALDFMDSMLADMDPVQVAGARHELAMGGWDAMEQYFEKKTDGWIHGWDQFVHDEAGDFADEQLMENTQVDITAKFEGCGNCPLCSLMSQEESTLLDAAQDSYIDTVGNAVFEATIMESVRAQMEDFAKKRNGAALQETKQESKVVKTVAPSTRKSKTKKRKL